MYIADLHIHSKYSLATSKDMDPDGLTRWAKLKGISLLGTGDFTHPTWLAELERSLEEVAYGVYRYKDVDFILSAEVSSIYFKAGKTRKVHSVLFAPNFKVAAEINRMLGAYGNLVSDGRPIIKLECDRLVRLVSSAAPDAFVVPGHIWTPHFSLFGSQSGFDSIEECFEDQTPKIFALETGLSSDPEMNWRWSALDRFSLISNSDAHSPAKLGREANVFKERMTYTDLFASIRSRDLSRFLFTIEFFPEEGKYHWDGHRACEARLSPAEAKKINNRCPRCGKTVTVGVLHRVEGLADREEGFTLKDCPPTRHLVPLAEIIAEALGVKAESVSVGREYLRLVQALGTEFRILLELDEREIADACPPKIAKGVLNMRKGAVSVVPGYDGEYGTVTVFHKGDETAEKQLSFF